MNVLLIGYGNPGRLDDGLGPALAAAVEKLGLPNLTVDSDYQLTVEDAEPVARHETVLFADASTAGAEPFWVKRIEAAEATVSFSSHSISPQGVLSLAKHLFGAAPRALVLGIRGYEFNAFGERLSAKAKENLAAAVEYVRNAAETGSFHEVRPEGSDLRREHDRPVKDAPMQDGKPVILAIDDDPDVREVLRTVLESNGYVFTEAASAAEGLKVYKQAAPEVILVDLMMEEVDAGASFVKELKALGSTVPIYMLSSVGDDLSQATDYAALGLAGVFQKPVNFENLLEVLARKLGR